MVEALIFYMFASVLIASSVAVILARNPVHSVLFLILAFVNAAGLFLLAGAEFLAFILLIVYVGAVAVLFLFVVMMLDINYRDFRQGITRYGPLALAVGVILSAELVFFMMKWGSLASNVSNPTTGYRGTNAQQLGQLLYTDYFLAFQISGLILLVAMVGAIVLTLRTRTGVKKQRIQDQLVRTPANTLEIRKVEFRQGVKIP